MGAMWLSRPSDHLQSEMACKRHSARVSRLKPGYLDGQVLGRVCIWLADGCDLPVFA